MSGSFPERRYLSTTFLHPVLSEPPERGANVALPPSLSVRDLCRGADHPPHDLRSMSRTSTIAARCAAVSVSIAQACLPISRKNGARADVTDRLFRISALLLDEFARQEPISMASTMISSVLGRGLESRRTTSPEIHTCCHQR